MKKSFLDFKRPPLVNMIIAESPSPMITTVRNAIYDGADAFGFQLERLKPEYRTENELKRIFSYTEDKPIYVTNYRGAHNKDVLSDDERHEQLKLALRCGATLIDLPGDTFDPTPGEMTDDPRAVEKQKKLIDEFHTLGAEVLMSAHVLKYMPDDAVIELALKQQARGADIAKFVTASDTEEELYANMQLIRKLKSELKIPFLFLSVGAYCKMHRAFGPYYGVCMWLCVQRYDAFSSTVQPLLSAMKNVRDHLDLTPNLV
ncbi:MAG: type I 3-dehydroquinate dehydratase [Clostridia bacterium]|nr:type I 3-dehydroquinate dehydratase [Clostridia bacterium]